MFIIIGFLIIALLLLCCLVAISISIEIVNRDIEPTLPRVIVVFLGGALLVVGLFMGVAWISDSWGIIHAGHLVWDAIYSVIVCLILALFSFCWVRVILVWMLEEAHGEQQ